MHEIRLLCTLHYSCSDPDVNVKVQVLNVCNETIILRPTSQIPDMILDSDYNLIYEYGI